MLALPSTASAYIGPGAGFALLSSFFVLLTTMVLALVALLRWPFRLVWRAVRAGQAGASADPAADRHRLRRPGAVADRSLSQGREAAAFRGAGEGRVLSPVEDDQSAGLAGGVVVVQHGHESGPPQHLRLPRSRSAQLSAAAVVDADRK